MLFLSPFFSREPVSLQDVVPMYKLVSLRKVFSTGNFFSGKLFLQGPSLRETVSREDCFFGKLVLRKI